MGLKMILILVTIGYTVSKWIGLKNKKDGKDKSSMQDSSKKEV
jgi:hypothetical protein